MKRRPVDPPRSYAPLAFALGLCALGAGSCGRPFDPYNRLTSFRVLALAASPSNPGPGETTTLSAVTYLPEVGPSQGTAIPGVTFAWSWCPFPGTADNGYACPITPDQVAMFAAAGVTLPPLDLGTAPTATFTHSIPAAALAQLCTGSAAMPAVADCDGGFPVEVKARIKTATDEIVSVYTLRLRFDPATTTNTAPTIDGIAATISEAPGVAAHDVPVSADAAVPIVRDEKTTIKVSVPLTAVESYVGKNDDLQVTTVKERLTLTWFVESGDTESDRTGYIDGGMFERALTNKWTPQKTVDYPKPTARVVVIVRDNRGGVAWRDGAVTLVEPKQ